MKKTVPKWELWSIRFIEAKKKGSRIRAFPSAAAALHTTVTAQITVEIDEDGNFRNAYPLSKEENFTIIPVTEKSGSRTAGKAPHPLCDNLQYLAGDYGKYAPVKRKAHRSVFNCTWMRWKNGIYPNIPIRKLTPFTPIFVKKADSGFVGSEGLKSE